MLLHIRCAHGAGFWLWLEHRADAARWIALRRAIVHSYDRPAGEAVEPVG
jgi:hypothetical protein